MEPIIRKSILTALAVAAAVSSQAGKMPPAIDTLTCNKKTVTDASRTDDASDAFRRMGTALELVVRLLDRHNGRGHGEGG